ncbi:PREDICTED: autophagy-related protein 9A-like [Priapulus caudatus]|uniref:Autophagy-related protein 9 n=1 Tax=Priapulus caudatus TaxID=37621 RepID=A0ABM1F3Z0_PRICU|nr:PREDICTED: autophagy-related protein 9A-like [Priapulus caudatus]
MTDRLQTSYQAMGVGDDDLSADSPHERLIMIHEVPENNKSRWNHVEDLDEFFTRVYRYHQKNGFFCMMLQEGLELVQFAFVVLFSLFLLGCVDYSRLHAGDHTHVNVTIWDAVVPGNQCMRSLSTWVVVLLLVPAVGFWLLQLAKVVYHFFRYLEIRAFYAGALRIGAGDLASMTWHEVQKRLLEAQKTQQMCVHKRELSELDIYHRILRFKNYFVAMVNKSLLPLRYRAPLLGADLVFLTRGLKYNLELILFWGPWAPFENNWHLKDSFKDARRRHELADFLARRILWVGVANFALCPLVFVWQVLYMFFSYGETIRREPGALGARRWSLYGRYYARHFNELDHELAARLTRGYRPAARYMSIFTSPVATVVARNVAFFAGALLVVLLILTLALESHVHVEHELALITALTVVITACRACIPDENMVWCPETLLGMVLAHVHYMPDSWKGSAHTTRVRDDFSQMFQYKAVFLLEELLSPIITPIILCFSLRHKALDIVDFFRNFTVDVIGVGDVCSFAQMDVRRHGNPTWVPEGQTQANHYQQAEDGKTELSLLHFTLTNPRWKPPPQCNLFITSVKEQVTRDVSTLHGPIAEETALYQSLYSMSSLGAGYQSLMTSLQPQLQSRLFSDRPMGAGSIYQSPSRSKMAGKPRGGVSRVEGPLEGSTNGVMGAVMQASGAGAMAASHLITDASLTLSQSGAPSQQPAEPGLLADGTKSDMSLSVLYLHELHNRRRRYGGYEDIAPMELHLQQRSSPDAPAATEGATGQPASQVTGSSPARLRIPSDLANLVETTEGATDDDDDDSAPLVHHAQIS